MFSALAVSVSAKQHQVLGAGSIQCRRERMMLSQAVVSLGRAVLLTMGVVILANAAVSYAILPSEALILPQLLA